MTDEPVHLSVVIPAFKEEARIVPTLDRVREYLDLQPYRSEVLVVVDGGVDATLSQAQRLGEDWSALRVLDNGRNRGKGYSVRRGMLEADGDYRLFSDADLSTPIEEVERLFGAMAEGAQVALGSRALAASDVRVRQAWWRQSMGRVFNRVVRATTVAEIADTQCGFKCFRREAAEQVFSRQRLDGFAFDVELLWIATKLGYEIAEVPVVWVNDPASRVHPVSDSVRMLLDLVRVRLADRRGLYDRGEQRRADRAGGLGG